MLTSPWPESVYAFAPMWATLAEHARLFAVDLPGFGASERRDDLLSPRAMGGFLAGLIVEAGLGTAAHRRPDVGTSAALFAAAAHPERIASVIVGTGGAAVPIELGEPLRSWVLDPDLDKYRRIDPRAIVNVAIDTIAGGVPDDIRADYLACYDGDRFVESMRYARRYPEELPELAELLPEITTPVTIINGRHDRVVPVANAEFLDERLPNSRLVIIDAGHFVWEEAPAEYAADHPRVARSSGSCEMTATAPAATAPPKPSSSGGGRRVRVPALRALRRGAARDAAALPRQPRQLGSGADRRARRRARDHPRRLPGRRVLAGESDATIAADGAAHDRVHRRARPR